MPLPTMTISAASTLIILSTCLSFSHFLIDAGSGEREQFTSTLIVGPHSALCNEKYEHHEPLDTDMPVLAAEAKADLCYDVSGDTFSFLHVAYKGVKEDGIRSDR